MALNHYEVARNLNEINVLVAMSAHRSTLEQQEQIKKLLTDYLTDKEITLRNLTEQETDRLLKLLNDAIAENRLDIKNLATRNSLTNWEQTLQHAVSRKGRLVDLYKQVGSSGMASDLLTHGFVPAGKWGTDLDVRQCLGKDMVDPKKIQAKGIYILPPVSLTESHLRIHDKIDEALTAIKTHAVNDPVSLRIPVNCGDNHWRLAKIEIKDAKIEAASLWDSLGGDPSALKGTKAYENLKSAVSTIAKKEVKVDVAAAGKQTNLYSCMDYCLQEALQNAGKANEIVTAKDASQLRVAVVKQIALNTNLGADVANNIALDANKNVKSTIMAKQPEIKIAPEKSQLISQSLEDGHNKEQQILFDEIFANKLQEIYNNNPNADEKAAQKAAYEHAVKETSEFGLFDDVIKSKHTP